MFARPSAAWEIFTCMADCDRQVVKEIHTTCAAAFIYSVAPVKKIYGVPPPRFNLVSQVLALFHHDWSRFALLLISFCS